MFGVGYHVATLAMIAGLNEVKGDLSDGHKKYHAALSKLKLATPLGIITLNENRQATGSVFVNEVAENSDGTLTNKMVARVDNVTQTLGMTADAFRKMGLPSRTTPDCKALGGK
jgi:branched-chain amino acid transport system substrate-binding protein